MEKEGLFHFNTESYLLDFRGRIPLPMIGNYLLHAASSHAGERGFGYSDMTEKHTAWVLSRMAIEIYAYPAMSEAMTVVTWVGDVGRLFTERCFELQNGEGKPFGFARSIWAAIDLETRRPTLLDVEGLSSFISERPCPIAKPGKILPVESETEGISFIVKYSDLDINGHLNSIKYIEHLLDNFDIKLFEAKEVSRFEIGYQAEGHYGMELKVHSAKTENAHYNMAITHEGKAICRASVTWKERT